MDDNEKKALEAAFPQNVSCFSNAWDTNPVETTTLGVILADVACGNWAAQIESVRNFIRVGNEKGYTQMKRKLPAIAISGTCATRDKNLTLTAKFKEHSGFLQIDLDKKDNAALIDATKLEGVKAAFRNDAHICAFFTSPSGVGLKAIVRIQPDVGTHARSFLAAEAYFKKEYDLQIDRSTKDPLRLCFVSHDADLYWRRAEAVPFEPLPAPKMRAVPSAGATVPFEPHQTTAEDIAEMLTFIPPKPVYEDWFRITSAVFSVLTLEEGFRILNFWSPEDSPGEYAKKWKARGKDIGIGTLVHYAKQGGFDPAAAAARHRWCGRIVFRHQPAPESIAHSPAGADAPPEAPDALAASRLADITEGTEEAAPEITSEFVHQCINDGQLGAARLWLTYMGGKAKFVPNGKRWHVFKDGIWERDEKRAVRAEMQEYIRATYEEQKKAIYEELKTRPDADLGKKDPRQKIIDKIDKRIAEVNSNAFIRGVEETAQHMAGVSLEGFDQKPLLLTCENGTLDLKLGEFREHRPKDLISKKLPIAFDPDAQCPAWEKFLNEIFQGKAELIEFVQRAVGYCLSGSVDADALFLLLGNGANGKSTFRAGLELLLGEYCGQIPINTLLASGNVGQDISYQKATLKGKRVVFTDEIPDGRSFNESELKAVSGGDLISARPIFGEPILFKPTHKLWLIGNHKPEVKDATDGTWRRLNLIWFLRQFTPEERRDRSEFIREFKAELPGILNWALRGWLAYEKIKLSPPEDVRNALREYRNEEDQIGAFCEDSIVKEKDNKIMTKIVFNVYRRWCEENGERMRCKKLTKFVYAMREQGFRVEKASYNKTYIFGIRVCGDTENAQNEEDDDSSGKELF